MILFSCGLSLRSGWLHFAVALVAIAALSGCGNSGGEKKEGGAAGKSGAAREFPVRIAKVTVQPVTYHIETVGDVVEENTFQIAARAAGSVQHVRMSEGDRVTTGMELCRIDYERYELLVNQGQNALEEARAAVKRNEADLADIARQTSSTVETARLDLELAESEYRRRQGLVGGQIISVEDRLNAELKYRRAKTLAEDAVNASRTKVALAQSKVAEAHAGVEAAQLALDLARNDLERAVVKAPIAGVIQQRLVSEGDYVKTGDTVAVMVQTDPLRLRFTVPPSKSAIITTNMTVRFSVPAHAQREFSAGIYDVGAVADPVSRAVTCWARISNPEGLLRPGNFAKVELDVRSNNEAVVAPMTAVLPTEAGVVVYLVQDGRAIRRKVTTGVQVSGDAIEIVEGLHPGETLVVDGGDSLTDNVPVRIVGDAVTISSTDGMTSSPGRVDGGMVSGDEPTTSASASGNHQP
ncbi:hypothetical protein CVU37_01880 [candidate division BRC1 bacterium HGW-BRC1-1]|nr:MAG: hypothetical protein CVU37_01880 [candidate division BRC1 bacterium HGW-BRC1-1]